jgi:hypothetical protein
MAIGELPGRDGILSSGLLPRRHHADLVQLQL